MTEAEKNSSFLSPCSWQDEIILDVQIFDTDCYGVMWHGSYTKWMEMGRVKLLDKLGIKLAMPAEESGYLYPVSEQHFRFKSPARYGDALKLVTGLYVDGFKLHFNQCFYNQKTGKTVIEAETLNLVVDMQWRLQRRLPDDITEKLSQSYSFS